MRIKTIMMSMLAMAALASCSNDDSNIPAEQAGARNLKLQFAGISNTRALETPGTPGTAQTVLTSATVYFFKADGSSATFNGGNLALDAAAITSAIGGGYIIEQVDADVASITIRANGGEQMVTDGVDINEFQGAEAADATNGFHKFLQLEGSADVVPSGTNTDGHALYKADVTLAPALARMEVTGGIDAKPVYTLGTEQLKDESGSLLYEHKKNDGTYYNSPSNIAAAEDDANHTITPAYAQIQTGYYAIKVKGVFMNNITLSYGSTLHPWNQVDAWATVYTAGGTHKNMYDALADATSSSFGDVTTGTGANWWTMQTAAADRNAAILDGKAAAYQIFSHASKATDKPGLARDLPHVIVELEVFNTKADYDAAKGAKIYANIRTFFKNSTDGKPTTDHLTKFENGKIYKISLNDLSDAFNKVTFENGVEVVPGPGTVDPDPDMYFDLQVKVTIVEWTVENLTPEL